MGLLSKVSQWRRRRSILPAPHREAATTGWRIPRFEQVEERHLMAADVHLGVVYDDAASGGDAVPNTFTVTFNGGAAGTELTHLTINLDKNGDNALSPGECFFNTAPVVPGVYGYSPLQIVSTDGVQVTAQDPANGSQLLTLNFSGFTAGKTVVFTIDVDETGNSAPDNPGGANAIAEGAEFEGSILTGTFSAPHYYDITKSDAFVDHFDPQLQQSGLPLPGDDYIGGLVGGTTVNNSPVPVHTAGGFVAAAQQALPVTLEGTVYYDPNLNNVQNPGEPGIPDVQLTLYSFNGTSYVSTGITTTTDANGHYKFTNVAPGNYRIVETQPSGYFSVGASAGNVNGVTDGVVTTPDILSQITVLGGEDVVHNDFSESLPNSISGRVIVDNYGGCDTNPANPPLAGVTVQLLSQSGTVLATTTTDANGEYAFQGLAAGTYSVRELTPTGYFAEAAHVGSVGGTVLDKNNLTSIILTSAIDGLRYDFCNVLPVDISGRVVVDTYGGCDTNPANPSLAGVTIQLLDQSGTVLATATTDANGEYEFQGYHPGTYTVHEITPTGYFAEAAHVGSQGGTVVDITTLGSIALTSGQSGEKYDFCVVQPVDISGRVFVDTYGGCNTNPANPSLAGVTIQLLDQSGTVLATTTTDANGEYEFQGYHPGTYTVHEITPTGYFAEAAHLGSQGGTVVNITTLGSIALTSGQSGEHYDFCLVQPVDISGRVFVDTYGGCNTNPANPSLAGVTIQLLDQSGTVLATTTTDVNGEYEFQGYHPGTYTVREITPTGYFAEAAHVGSQGGTVVNITTLGSIALTSGQSGENYDFCLVQPVGISGEVVVDKYGGCDTNPANPRLSGVTVQLLDQNGAVLATTTTDAQGQYSFDGLKPGTYTVRKITPNGYFDLAAHVGSVGGVKVDLGTISDISLTSGVHGLRYDFCEQAPGSISGLVLINTYGGCDTNPANPPLGGVEIQLQDQNGNILATAVTDANGAYSFQGLKPGTYTVHKVSPQGYFDVASHLGSAGGVIVDLDTVGTIAVTSGLDAVRYDFCEAEPSSLSGRVFNDIYGGCNTNPANPTVAGVTIQLLDENNQVLATAVTDANGYYLFANLAPGTYGVHEVQPAGYFEKASHVGSAGGQTVSIDGTAYIGITSGVNAVKYDFCVISPSTISGYVFQDGGPIGAQDPANDLPFIMQNLPSFRDGVLTPDDTRLSGVTLMLADAAGQVLLDSHGNPITTATDANGYYQFTGLPPGTYTVLKVHPDGYIDGINTAGTTGGLAISPTLLSFGLMSQGVSASDALLQSVGVNDAIAMISINGGQVSLNNNFSEITIVQQDLPPVLNPPLNLPGSNYALLASPYLSPASAPLAPSAPPVIGPYLYGSWGANGTTWHLSVIDAGLPRGVRSITPLQLHLTGSRFSRASWHSSKMTEGLWRLHPGEVPGASEQSVTFGKLRGIPVTGDFNGDGVTEVGIFVDGEWFIDLNGNGVWDKDDLWAKLGSRDDKPVTGDWDGDGKTDIGIFGPAWPGDPRAVASEPGLPDPNNVLTGVPKNVPPKRHEATLGWRTMRRTEEGEVRADLIDHVFHFGTPDDIPVTGDWTGSGIDTIGIFHKGRWILDVDGDGKRSEKDRDLHLGQAGDKPVVGDFNGDGVDELGVYRDGEWHIDINHDYVLDDQDLRYQLGGAEHRPVVGDWDGDGCDQIGIHQEQPAGTNHL